ncbi:MAG: DUF1292 domain-containing protein [Bacilli bacterium]|nr:DUF1292 domain-containing protein [Bacilli bacterium]MDD3422015.1 DUF1292 domain-containing protein [Bacilli bacterium]MDD4065392.1 DUF1292 domain-containing protein [Bacilli bacterium]
MDDDVLYVSDEQGNEITMKILFTFEDERLKRKYVVYCNPANPKGDTYASIFDDDGHLYPIESDEEWDMVEEVLGSFMEENQNGTIKVQEKE